MNASVETNPRISVVVLFHDMGREAVRTLFSLTTAYQRGVAEADYEVLAIDNGSREPLDASWVRGFGPRFEHRLVSAAGPSPCAALNRAAASARGEWLVCLIDGARILTPRILEYVLEVSGRYDDPFVYTLGMHLGPKPQNYSIVEGYDRETEDRLLDSIDWRSDGYRLFEISSVALSSKEGFYSELTESNCFAMRRASFLGMGGYDERFVGPGGGLANLDFFNRVHEDPRFTPVMLLGEATFHQLHGGVATNVPINKHPWRRMEREYRRIRGRAYAPVYRRPVYHGSPPPVCRRLLKEGETR
jgi:hypothetical protein